MNIIPSDNQDPNFNDISQYLKKEFPIFHAGNSNSIADAVTEEIIGSRQVRMSGRPDIESAYHIRYTIKKAIKKGEPIPILTVSAPKKPDPMKRVDIAELSMLNMLNCLNNRVKYHYSPGITVNMRIEDLTGTWLEEGSHLLHESIELYSTSIELLPMILDYRFIHTVRESDMPNSHLFMDMTEELFPHIMYYIQASDGLPEDSWGRFISDLNEIGFSGQISRETRDFYYKRYLEIFGEDKPKHFYQSTLAKYYSSILARTKLKMIGSAGLGDDFLYVSFTNQVPGVDSKYTMKKLYYRSIPMSMSKLILPFWRSKGILSINGEVTPKLVPWKNDLDIRKMSVVLSNNKHSVEVDTDYVEVTK